MKNTGEQKNTLIQPSGLYMNTIAVNMVHLFCLFFWKAKKKRKKKLFTQIYLERELLFFFLSPTIALHDEE